MQLTSKVNYDVQVLVEVGLEKYYSVFNILRTSTFPTA